MKRNNYGCLITLLIGVIFGIIVGYNAFLAVFPGTTTVIGVALGIGAGALALITLLATFACGRREKCIYQNGICIAVPAVGTIIAAIIGLAITITAESIGIAVLIGLGTLFLTMTILNLLNLIICLVNDNCECR